LIFCPVYTSLNCFREEEKFRTKKKKKCVVVKLSAIIKGSSTAQLHNCILFINRK
jgi:hypothetical protein